MAYFVARYSGPGAKALTLYGPFPNEEEAQEANFFGTPQDEVNRALKQHGAQPWRDGVQAYSRDELVDLQDDPGAYEFRSVVLKPASALRAHPSWRSLTLDHHGYFMYVTTGDTAWLEKKASYDCRNRKR